LGVKQVHKQQYRFNRECLSDICRRQSIIEYTYSWILFENLRNFACAAAEYYIWKPWYEFCVRWKFDASQTTALLITAVNRILPNFKWRPGGRVIGILSFVPITLVSFHNGRIFQWLTQLL